MRENHPLALSHWQKTSHWQLAIGKNQPIGNWPLAIGLCFHLVRFIIAQLSFRSKKLHPQSKTPKNKCGKKCPGGCEFAH
jgi:hypothetical protein